MQVRLLGPLTAEGNGSQARLGGRQRRAVLALLALAEGRVVSVDALIEALWGERPPSTAANTVQVHVSALRKALAMVGAEREAIAREGGGYRLALSPASLDHVRFVQLAAEAETLLAAGNAERARSTFADALSLWRGPALADFEYDAWAQPEARRLEDGRLACLEGRLEAELASGHDAELVGELELMAGQHPQRERFTAQRMLALYRAGRQAEALEVYQQARQRLVDELGIEPTPELQELNRRILNQDESLAGPTRAEPPSVRLPTAPTALVGRRRELAELDELLADDDVAPDHRARPGRGRQDTAGSRGRRGCGGQVSRRRQLGGAARAPRREAGRLDDRANARNRGRAGGGDRRRAHAARARQLRAGRSTPPSTSPNSSPPART